MPFIAKLREGHDLVMGNRFKGTIKPGAMSPLHRYFGNPVLSGIGRLFFGRQCGDFHCGLRGFRKEAVQRMALRIVNAGVTGYSSHQVLRLARRLARTLEPDIALFLVGWNDGTLRPVNDQGLRKAVPPIDGGRLDLGLLLRSWTSENALPSFLRARMGNAARNTESLARGLRKKPRGPRRGCPRHIAELDLPPG